MGGSLWGITDKWYQSRTFWTALITAIITLLKDYIITGDAPWLNDIQTIGILAVAWFIRLGFLNDKKQIMEGKP